MKNLLFFSLMILGLLSCQSDDCQKSDFIGSWKGTEKCGSTVTENVIIDITDKPASDWVIINGGSFADEEAEVEGCSLDGSILVLGIGIEIKATLEVSTLKISRTNNFLGLEDGCEYTLTKQ